MNKITLVDFDEYMILNLITLVECDWKIRCWILHHFAFHTMSVLTFKLTVLFSMVLFNWHFLLLSYLQEQERSHQYQKQLEDIKSQINKSGNKSAVCVDLSCQGRADLSYQMYIIILIYLTSYYFCINTESSYVSFDCRLNFWTKLFKRKSNLIQMD